MFRMMSFLILLISLSNIGCNKQTSEKDNKPNILKINAKTAKEISKKALNRELKDYNDNVYNLIKNASNEGMNKITLDPEKIYESTLEDLKTLGFKVSKPTTYFLSNGFFKDLIEVSW